MKPVLLAALTAALLPLPAHAGYPTAERETLAATVWMQGSVEMGGVTRSVYHAATLAIPAALAATTPAASEAAGDTANKPPAVVLDIDETVLNNVAYNARQTLQGKGFEAASWERWVASAQAPAIEGAKTFLDTATQHGMKVIFITNRECDKQGGYDQRGRALVCPQRAATLKNLEVALGRRPADDELLMRNELAGRDDRDKSERRREVSRNYRIALLVGDDLEDFISRSRYQPELYAGYFGTRWFVLPNPVYGSWKRQYKDSDALYRGLKPWNDTP